MKQQEKLLTMLQHPGSVGPEDTDVLKNLLKQYPYFQAARAIHLKALKTSNSLHYNKELKVTAAYTADRGVLFDFITSKAFNQDDISRKIKDQDTGPEEASGDQNLSLDKALKMKIRESEQVFDPDLFKKPASPSKADPEDSLQIGKPLHFNREESHSFSQWLKLTSAAPIKRENKVGEDHKEKNRKLELIEDFISKNPRINPAKSTKKINLAEERLTAPEALMTETLARVYLEQKNYQKAIQAYKILILKNPEKSGFFADQIRAIEKLKENNT